MCVRRNFVVLELQETAAVEGEQREEKRIEDKAAVGEGGGEGGAASKEGGGEEGAVGKGGEVEGETEGKEGEEQEGEGEGGAEGKKKKKKKKKKKVATENGEAQPLTPKTGQSSFVVHCNCLSILCPSADILLLYAGEYREPSRPKPIRPQKDPPTVPIADMYTDHVYPTGQEVPYPVSGTCVWLMIVM